MKNRRIVKGTWWKGPLYGVAAGVVCGGVCGLPIFIVGAIYGAIVGAFVGAFFGVVLTAVILLVDHFVPDDDNGSSGQFMDAVRFWTIAIVCLPLLFTFLDTLHSGDINTIAGAVGLMAIPTVGGILSTVYVVRKLTAVDGTMRTNNLQPGTTVVGNVRN